jgi:hypothetical protein
MERVREKVPDAISCNGSLLLDNLNGISQSQQHFHLSHRQQLIGLPKNLKFCPHEVSQILSKPTTSSINITNSDGTSLQTQCFSMAGPMSQSNVKNTIKLFQS